MLLLAMPGAVLADIYTFDFTGRMTVATVEDGSIEVINLGVEAYNGYQMPVSASLTYDTFAGFGASPLTVTLSNLFFGLPATFHDISLSRIGTSNLISGNVLIDFSWSTNMNAHIEWDATGFFNAINSGLLEIGDKISGDVLLRDVNGDGNYDKLDPTEIVMLSLGSATPYTDTLLAGTSVMPQFNAPLAATYGTGGVYGGTPFDGALFYLDIGSGNSMYVTGVISVPEPEAYAMMLTGFGLVSWVARRRRQVH